MRLTTDNAGPLRCLLNAFDCRALHVKLSSIYIPRDMNANTAPGYAIVADELNDVKLQEWAVQCIAERFDDVAFVVTKPESSSYPLRHMPPRLFRKVLKSDKLICRGGSERISEIVAEYVRHVDNSRIVDRPSVSTINEGGGGR